MNIAKFCIRHKVTTLLAVIMIAVFGVVYTTQLQMALLPNIEYPAAYVYCYYNGAGPEDIEQLVTRPLESAIMSVPGVDSVTSSSADSISTIQIMYVENTDVDIAATKLREKFDALSLPDGCGSPVILNINVSEMMPSAIVGLLGDDLAALQHAADEARHLLHVAFHHAACSHGRGSHAHAAGNHGAERFAGDGVLVDGDVCSVKEVFDFLAGSAACGQINEHQVKKILEYIEIAKQEGARVACGGERATEGDLAKGCFMKPTLLVDVDNHMRVAQEEIFGPVACVIKFHDEDEVIAMANDSAYGLGGAVWTRDGFYYSGYDEPKQSEALVAQNRFQKIFFHKLGTEQSADRLIYEDRAHPLRYVSAEVSKDDRHLFVFATEGTSGNEVLWADLSKGAPEFEVLFPGFANDYALVHARDGRAVFYTNEGAPRYRLVQADLNGAEPVLSELLPESELLLEGASVAGGSLFALYLDKAQSAVSQYDLSGKKLRDLKLPGIGAAAGFAVRSGSRYRQMPPFVWPGVAMTFHFMFPTSTTSPWATVRSTGQGTPRVERSSSQGSSISGASMADAMTGTNSELFTKLPNLLWNSSAMTAG